MSGSDQSVLVLFYFLESNTIYKGKLFLLLMEELRTYKGELADFCLSGKWKLVGYFEISGPIASVNGQLCRVYDNGNYSPINKIGENICNCYVCGYCPLVNHYTLKDLNTGKMVNVGSECLFKILNTKKADHIKNYIETLKRQITTDFKRPIKNEYLKEYTKQVYDVEKARDVRKARILSEIQNNPELYWKNKHPFKYDPKTQKSSEDLTITVPDSERSKDAISNMNQDINFWVNMKEHYNPIGNNNFYDSWSPDNMIRQMKKEAEKDKLTVPKFPKLTTDQQEQLSQKVEIAIN